MVGVGELVIFDVLLHFSASFTSLFECCGCVSVYDSSFCFFFSVSKKKSIPILSNDWYDTLSLCSLQLFTGNSFLSLLLFFSSSFLTFSLFTFSFQSSVQDWGEEVEEGAIYNVTLKRVQIQQAANKGARWLGVSVPISCLPVWWSWQSFSRKETRSQTLQTLRQTDHTYENLMLFPLSEPVAVQNVKCWFLPKVEKSLPLESIMCKWFIKAIQLVVCRLLSSKTKKN